MAILLGKNKHNEAVDVGIPQTLTSLVLENNFPCDFIAILGVIIFDTSHP
jgi:hypothetical protein